MEPILILYATREGQTAKIALYASAVAREAGYAVDVLACDKLPDQFTLDRYRAAIVAASVHAGQHEHCARDFVRAHRPALETLPSAFLSVSLSAAGGEPQHRDAELVAQQFLSETGWRPARTLTVAGALKYREYNPLLRLVIRRISRRAGGPTDTSRDYELTDWTALKEFMLAFLESTGGTPATRAATTSAAVPPPSLPALH